MKKVVSKVLTFILSVVLALSMVIPSMAFDGGSSGSLGCGSGGGVGKNDLYSYAGIKITVARRDQVLSKGWVNWQAYDTVLRNSQGLVCLMTADGDERPDLANNEWKSMGGTAIAQQNNIGGSCAEIANLLRIDANELRSRLQGIAMSNAGKAANLRQHTYYGWGLDWSGFAQYLTVNLNSDNSMLYKNNQRRNFYRRFVEICQKQGGVAPAVSEKVFMSQDGVLVIEPVVGVCRGNNNSSQADIHSGPWLTWQTAERFNREIGTDIGWTGNGFAIKTDLLRQVFCNGEAVSHDTNDRGYQGIFYKLNSNNTTCAMAASGTWVNSFDIDGNYLDRRTFDGGTQFYDAVDGGERGHGGQDRGFLVFGLGAGCYNASNLAVRATQNKDGSFEVDTKASWTKDESGDLSVDTKSLQAGSSKSFSDVQGGADSTINGGSNEVRLTNVTSDWVDGYTSIAHGAFEISGGPNNLDETKLEAFRETLDGSIDAKEEVVNSGDFNDGSIFTPDWKYSTPQAAANAYAAQSWGGHVTRKLTQEFKTKRPNIVNLAYNLTAWASNESSITDGTLTANANVTAGTGTIETGGADSEMGVAVEYLVKYEPVKSFISYAKITYDEDGRGTMTIGNNDKVDYDKGSEGHFTVDKPYFVITTVSNCKADDNYRLSDDNRDGESYWSKVESDLQYLNTLDPYVAENRDRIDEIAKQYLADSAKTSLGTKSGSLVSLGSDNGCGYSVFVLEIDVPSMKPERVEDEVPETPENPSKDPNPYGATTWIDLQDYQLNFIHQNYLDHSWGQLTNMGGEDPVNPNVVTKAYCVVSQNNGHSRWLSRAQEYRIVHNSLSGVTLNADNAKPYSFLYYNKANGDAYTLAQMKQGVRNINANTYKNYTYAWDISRGIFGDVRTISALSADSMDNVAMQYMQAKHNHIYGIAPDEAGGAPKSSVLRNSFGTIQNGIADTLKYSAEWEMGAKTPQDEIRQIHSGQITDADGVKLVQDTMFKLGDKGVSGARPIAWNSIHKYTDDVGSFHLYDITLDVHEIIYKYSTEEIAIGKNDKAETNLSAGKKLSGTDYGYGDDDANLSKDNLLEGETDKGIMYRNAVIADSTIDKLSYYPEVRMRAYLAEGDTIDGKGSIKPQTIITMAELIRATKPSSMYLIKVDSGKTDGTQQLTGEIYSDTMGAGTSAEEIGKGSRRGSKSLPVIYGGSDVTLDMNPEDFNIRLYGYALDLVNYDIDNANGLKYAVDEDGNGVYQPYRNIVNDTGSANRDPYSSWGNDSTDSANVLQKQFNDWVEDIVNSVDADVTLKVSEADSSGNLKSDIAKEFNNFSVAMPTLKADDYKTTETDGVFNIVVKRGDVDRTTTEFKALINQIAEDYGCTTEMAEKLFNDSGMYQSILNGIEDIKDDFNKAQNVNTDEEGAHAVREDNTDTHWYDEEVKTFVIRRYQAEPINIDNLVLTDKIDYDVSPDSTAGNRDNRDDAQQSSYDQRIGQWYLSLYIRKPEASDTDFNIHFTDKDHYFNPDTATVRNWLESPEGDANKILINNVYVDGADFKIPSADTSETLW